MNYVSTGVNHVGRLITALANPMEITQDPNKLKHHSSFDHLVEVIIYAFGDFSTHLL